MIFCSERTHSHHARAKGWFLKVKVNPARPTLSGVGRRLFPPSLINIMHATVNPDQRTLLSHMIEKMNISAVQILVIRERHFLQNNISYLQEYVFS